MEINIQTSYKSIFFDIASKLTSSKTNSENSDIEQKVENIKKDEEKLGATSEIKKLEQLISSHEEEKEKSKKIDKNSLQGNNKVQTQEETLKTVKETRDSERERE